MGGVGVGVGEKPGGGIKSGWRGIETQLHPETLARQKESQSGIVPKPAATMDSNDRGWLAAGRRRTGQQH